MSTVTTICGLAPLVFLPGAGTELYRGVGAIVLFGILGTAIITLTFLPALSIAVLRGAGYRAGPEVKKSRAKPATKSPRVKKSSGMEASPAPGE
jgi:hypothetical protein